MTARGARPKPAPAPGCRVAAIREFVYPPDWSVAPEGVSMSSQTNGKVSVNAVARAVSAVLAGGGYAPALIAQTQTGGLEEIIVTARKREESLLSIPQEIQAIGQQEIEQANLNTLDDIARFVPSLSFNAVTPGRGTIYFRGVADDSSSFIADASAAIYLDEQPLTQSSLQPEIRLVDIERIEALPGPQGTLYGASSQSGTLRYITNKPDPAGFESNVSLEGTSVEDGDVGYDLSAVLNVPLGDNMAIRLVGFTAHEAGFIDNVFGTSLGGTFDNADVVDDDINGIDYSGGRAAFRWLPNDEWTVDVGVVYQKMKANAYSEDNVQRSGRELAVVRFFDESRDDEWVQTSLTLQGDLGWGQFTSATSYFTRSNRVPPGQHRLHVLPEPVLRRLLRQLRPRPGSAWPRLERQSGRAACRTGISSAGRDGQNDLAGRAVLRARSRRLQLLQPHRGLRGFAGRSTTGRRTTTCSRARRTTRSTIRRTTRSRSNTPRSANWASR